MKIKIEKIKNLLKKIPKVLAGHPFLTFCGLLVVALILGGVIFYKYSILAEKSEIEISKETLRFKQKIYQEVSNQWQQREEKLKKVDLKQYINPFQEIEGEVSISTSSEEATSTPEELPPEELPPEEPSLPSNVKELLAAANLFEFYGIKGEKLPSVWERGIIWREKGLGLEKEYKGTDYQNMILLKKLKEELVP